MDMNADQARATWQAEVNHIAIRNFNGDTSKAEAFIRGRRQGQVDGLIASGKDMVQGGINFLTGINEALKHPNDTMISSAKSFMNSGQYVEEVAISAAQWKLAYDHALATNPEAAGYMEGVVKGRVTFGAAEFFITRRIAEFPQVKNALSAVSFTTTSGSTFSAIPARWERIRKTLQSIESRMSSSGSPVGQRIRGSVDFSETAPGKLREATNHHIVPKVTNEPPLAIRAPSTQSQQPSWNQQLNQQGVLQARYGQDNIQQGGSNWHVTGERANPTSWSGRQFSSSTANNRQTAARSTSQTSLQKGNSTTSTNARAATTRPANRGADKPSLNAAAQRSGSDIPYNSRTIMAELEAKYGRGNVTSTTVPPANAPNVRYAGRKHPDSGVVFDNKGFPIFDDIAKYDTRLDQKAFYETDRRGQMRMATRDLREQINSGEISRSQFSPEQLKAIQSGRSKIPELTWHHHQDRGRMQLVPEERHDAARHIGGDAMSKGK